jgi:hypothetical protein
MRTTLLKFIQTSLLFAFIFGMTFSSLLVRAQEAEEGTDQDSTEVIEDNSSSFNDSVQFDDMEPVFYEAAEDEPAVADKADKGDIMLYVGIAVVLVVVLIVLKKVSKKKS